MDFNFDTGAISNGLQTLDVSTTPPAGGTAGVLSITGTGAVLLTAGTAAQRPSGVAGMLRFNSDVSDLEFYNGTAWVANTIGTVTSVGATGSTGLTVGNSPITTSGTLTFTLASILQSLTGLATSGLMVNNAGTIGGVTIAGTVGNITVTNGSGVAGAPTINLATAGTAVTGQFVSITTDAFGRVTGTAAASVSNITTALGYTPVNKTGDTMSGSLNMGNFALTGLATPVNQSDAVPLSYLQSVTAGLEWKGEVAAASTTALTVTYSSIAGTLTNAGTQTAFAVDTYNAVQGDRILIKNQGTAYQNGIYTVTTVGSASTNWVLTRAIDANTSSALTNATTLITNGSQANTGWTQTVANPSLTAGSITFVQFSGSNLYTAGSGLSLSGNTFSITAPVIVALGGTGLTTAPTNGQLLIGNGAGYTLAGLTQGSGITVTNGSGTITVANAGVLSITGTANQVIASTSTGAVTLSLPQSIGTGSSPTFAGLTDTGLTANSFVYSGVASLLTSTAAPTNGQLLIGSTGASPVAAALTAGTAISIANAAGSITINNTGVTSNAAGTGISVSSSTGAVTITNTGVTSIVAGTGISISGGTGAVTVNNSGVTSVGLSLPSIFTVTVSPITTTGSLTATLASQAANTVFTAPNGSAGAPTFRALVYADLPLKLYAEAPSVPVAPSATGTNAIALGSGSVASSYGELAFAGGDFATAGDAQFVKFILRNITATATATELFLDGTSASQRFVLPNNSAMSFRILVSARRTNSVGGAAGYAFEGNIRKDTTSASTTFTGTPSKTVLGETAVVWDAAISADTTNGSLKITVTGEANTIRWVAVVDGAMVTN